MRTSYAVVDVEKRLCQKRADEPVRDERSAREVLAPPAPRKRIGRFRVHASAR